MKRYRRIEVNAFRRKVTIVSGEWPQEICDGQLAQTDDGTIVIHPEPMRFFEAPIVLPLPEEPNYIP